MIFGSETKLRCTIYQFLFLSPAAAPEDDPSRGFILQPAQSLARPGERRVIISVPCSSDWLVQHKRMLMLVSL